MSEAPLTAEELANIKTKWDTQIRTGNYGPFLRVSFTDQEIDKLLTAATRQVEDAGKLRRVKEACAEMETGLSLGVDRSVAYETCVRKLREILGDK